MRRRDIVAVINSALKAKEKIKIMNKIYPQKYYDALCEIGESVITEWYSKYPPIMYDRIGSLYNAFTVELDGTEYSVEFNSDLMEREKSDLIFQNSFINGYHGGASKGTIRKKDQFGNVIYEEPHPHPGIPYWQTPIPQFGHWGRPARRDFSPYRKMVDKMNKKISEIDSEKQKEYDDIIEKVEKAINRLV